MPELIKLSLALLLLGAVAGVALSVATTALENPDTAVALSDGVASPAPAPSQTSPAAPQRGPDPTGAPAPASSEAVPPPPTEPPFRGWVDPESVGEPYGEAVEGLLTFRGNPTRTFYGSGPVPQGPQVVWRYPSRGALCGLSTVGGATKEWCGTGWTGQPAVFERDGRTWVVFGAYDHAVHFVDGNTGGRILPSFSTGDIIKGSVTVDPDGFPLVYTGSRDDRYRILAVDRDEPVELWSLHADDAQPALWNNDWDGAGLVLDDYLIVGGENSRFHIVKLNRAYNDDGLVTVDPKLVFHAAGWDDRLLADVGDTNVSIENSVAVVGDTVYFANSGGLVQGWDIGDLRDGATPRRVFRFWTGDDVDATVVADADGMLYVASEWERHNDRAREVGQIVKLDPSRRRDPLVWSYDDQAATGPSGVWATPALHRDVVYVPTHGGVLLALDRRTGDLRWSKQLAAPTWSSPVVVDDVLIQGDCAGQVHAYDVADTSVEPDELWSVEVGGCVESTPAVWDGRVYVGTRAGYIAALADG